MADTRNTIPEPTPTVEGLLLTVRAMKEVIEQMSGQRPNSRGRAPRVFTQALRPDGVFGGPFGIGDLWIETGSDAVHYWEGRFWKPIGN